MAADTGQPLTTLRVDGGAARNEALLQVQADLLDVAIERPVVAETTALGAACLAGLAIGLWSRPEEIAATWALDRRFEPAMTPADRAAARRTWARAVDRARGWATEQPNAEGNRD
jgi:glycerol kinase